MPEPPCQPRWMCGCDLFMQLMRLCARDYCGSGLVREWGMSVARCVEGADLFADESAPTGAALALDLTGFNKDPPDPHPATT